MSVFHSYTSTDSMFTNRYSAAGLPLSPAAFNLAVLRDRELNGN